MHVAALVGSLRQNLAQRPPQAGMMVGDDKFDAVQTARLHLMDGNHARPFGRANPAKIDDILR